MSVFTALVGWGLLVAALGGSVLPLFMPTNFRGDPWDLSMVGPMFLTGALFLYVSELFSRVKKLEKGEKE
jgi:hypothetical protein